MSEKQNKMVPREVVLPKCPNCGEYALTNRGCLRCDISPGLGTFLAEAQASADDLCHQMTPATQARITILVAIVRKYQRLVAEMLPNLVDAYEKECEGIIEERL